MAKPENPIRYQRLNAAKQLAALEHNPLCDGHGTVSCGVLTWEFVAQPTPLSRQYLIRIVFRQGEVPNVYVIDPDLKALANSRRLPHVYEQQPARLCLYLPRGREWNGSMRISETTIPWTVLWLYYFEDWLATDEWKGGGKHPELNDGKRKKNTVDRWWRD